MKEYMAHSVQYVHYTRFSLYKMYIYQSLMIYLLRYDSYLSRYSTGQINLYPTIVVDIDVCPV